MTRGKAAVGVAAVGAALMAVSAAIVPASGADAASDPFGTRSVTHDVSISADGTYSVAMTQKQEMLAPYKAAFGGVIHDGFRLEDDDTPIPPYLRAEYAVTAAAVDGDDVDLSVESDRHSVGIVTRKKVDTGDHTATIGYRVSNAAYPTDEGYQVFIRTLRPGTTRISADDPITQVRCVTVPPAAEECGTQNDDGTWTVKADALNGIRTMRVEVAGDPSRVPSPEIDHG